VYENGTNYSVSKASRESKGSSKRGKNKNKVHEGSRSVPDKREGRRAGDKLEKLRDNLETTKKIKIMSKNGSWRQTKHDGIQPAV